LMYNEAIVNWSWLPTHILVLPSLYQNICINLYMICDRVNIGRYRERGWCYCQGNAVRLADSWPKVTVHAHGGLFTVGRPDWYPYDISNENILNEKTPNEKMLKIEIPN
jgi:hypothetical protein